MAIHVKFLGGAGTVTGSSHLIRTEKSEILLDAGLFHGHREEFYAVNTNFNYNPRKLDAVILSHAHIDHCGNLPSIIKRGLRCKIYTTSATKDLARLMLEDSGKIQEEDVRYLNKINRRFDQALRKPLYTKKEASKATRLFRSLAYNQKFCVAGDVFVTLYNAGHILGSSTIVLDIKDGKKNIRLGYAVDLGRKNLPLLDDPVVPKDLDYLIIESTYGGKLHAPIEEAKGKLQDAICRTIERKGKVIIPSFSLERTQEVLYFLNELLKDKAIPEVPIYVDSPLASDITDVFKYHMDYFNGKTRKAFHDGDDPFTFLNLKFIRKQEESKALNNDPRSMIIVSSSGMCEAGRVLHHLKNNIEDSRNMVLVVGYMAKNTLGRRIVERQKFLRIYGMEYELNAEVRVINSFSGHADQEGLLEFIQEALPLKRTFLVHGDPEQSEILLDILRKKNLNAYIPKKDEEAELNNI